MRTYVISLERATERRRHIEAQVRELEHEFVDTVDGRSLDREEWPSWLPLGLVGCCLSQLVAYRRIVERGEPGLVVEDDAVLPENLPQLLDGLTIEPGDVVLLHYVAQRRLELVGDGPVLDPRDPENSGLGSTAAYAIGTEAAARLLEFNPAQRGFGPDDWKSFPVRTRCYYPRPVTIRTDFPSTIGYSDKSWVSGHLRAWNRRRIQRRMSRFVHVDATG